MMGPGPALDDARAIVERAAAEAGRDPATIGMEGRVDWRGDGDAVADQLARVGEGRRVSRVGQHHGRRAEDRRRSSGRAGPGR